MTDKFRNKYRIPSDRAPWHDYNGGAYFITICTYHHLHYLGEIVDDGDGNFRMVLSEIGRYVEECIGKMESLHNDIKVPLFQIMPNHIHLIIIVERPFIETSFVDSLVSSFVETSQYGVSTKDDTRDGKPDDDEIKNVQMQAIANQCGRLSHVISRFKYAVTKFARANSIPFEWQTRFHDHIIRNNDEWNGITRYIKNNVPKWGKEKLNSKIG